MFWKVMSGLLALRLLCELERVPSGSGSQVNFSPVTWRQKPQPGRPPRGALSHEILNRRDFALQPRGRLAMC